MQQRRFRPGDVVDDYCPRERRITDHAVVAMIDERVKQTRCCVCDAEHEYKDGKVPAQRRKKPQPALFTQVLEGLQGPQSARLAQPDGELLDIESLSQGTAAPTLPSLQVQTSDTTDHPEEDVASGNGHSASHDVVETLVVAAAGTEDAPPRQEDTPPARDEGSVRRSLIRATLPRPEGQPAPTRVLPEFTIRQPNNGRGPRPGGRRRGGHQQQGQGTAGPMRFGRGGRGQGQGHGQEQGQGHGQGQSHGQRQHGGRNHGPNGGRGPRRGGKKR